MRADVKKRIRILPVLILIIQLSSVCAFAADGTVDIISEASVKKGGSFTVTVRYSDNVGRVDAGVRYDADVLEYVSGGNSSGSGGYVDLSTAASGERIVFQLEFNALRAGDTVIRVDTREMYDYEEREMNRPSSETSVTVTEDPDSAQGEVADNDREDGSGTDIAEEDRDGIFNNNSFVILGGCIVLVALALVIVIFICARKKKR